MSTFKNNNQNQKNKKEFEPLNTSISPIISFEKNLSYIVVLCLLEDLFEDQERVVAAYGVVL